MVNRTAWTAGNGVGFTWSTLLQSSDLASLPSTQTVLSTVGDITNQTALDMWMDISMALVIASSTIAAGANFAFYLYALNQDGTTYGDGQFTAGTQSALVPAMPSVASINVPAVASVTNIRGNALGIWIPPGSFRFAMQNNCGFALTSGTQTVKYRTYNLNLNN